MSQLPIQM